MIEPLLELPVIRLGFPDAVSLSEVSSAPNPENFPAWRPGRHVVECGHLEVKLLRLERFEAADLVKGGRKQNPSVR